MTWSLDISTQAALLEGWHWVSFGLVPPTWQSGSTHSVLAVPGACLNLPLLPLPALPPTTRSAVSGSSRDLRYVQPQSPAAAFSDSWRALSSHLHLGTVGKDGTDPPGGGRAQSAETGTH